MTYGLSWYEPHCRILLVLVPVLSATIPVAILFLLRYPPFPPTPTSPGQMSICLVVSCSLFRTTVRTLISLPCKPTPQQQLGGVWSCEAALRLHQLSMLVQFFQDNPIREAAWHYIRVLFLKEFHGISIFYILIYALVVHYSKTPPQPRIIHSRHVQNRSPIFVSGELRAVWAQTSKIPHHDVSKEFCFIRRRKLIFS